MKTMKEVIEIYPNLRHGGFIWSGRAEYGTIDELLADEGKAKIVAQWLLENFEMSSNIRRWTTTGSYGWKHIAENVLGKSVDGYVCNGTFIAAAIMADVQIRPYENSPNARIGITEKSLTRFNKLRTTRKLSTVYL